MGTQDSREIKFSIDGVAVVYVPAYFAANTPASVDHFDLYSSNISETGYKSCFVPSHEVEDYKQCAEELIRSLWIESANQMQLF